MHVLVVNHVSLDGVMQSPGRPDEDTRGDFQHGGWAQPAADPTIGAAMSERMGPGFSWLFGRRSYEEMLSHWNRVGGQFKDGLNGANKFVVSSNPDIKLPWPNSTLLTGDVPGEIAALRQKPGGNLVVMGSGELVRSLLPHGLVDELMLMIHPIVLGSGRRLFGPDDDTRDWRLLEATTTATGVVITTYATDRSQS